MATHDYVIDNQSFPSFRSDLNSVLQAIVSNNSGTSAPSTTFANQIWYDTSANILYIRNEDNDANIPLFQLDQSADVAATIATIIDVLDASGTNAAGTSLTIRGGAGTGTGAGGSILLQTADGGSSGSSVNSHATRLSVSDAGDVALPTDSAKIAFGADAEIELSHVADSGLTLKHTATADDKPVNLTLATGETDIAANDVIGKINFQAPDEGTGTDAILVAAAIQGRSEGDFSASSNATSLDFMTGSSEAATTKMSLTSGGNLGLGTSSPTFTYGGGIEIERADSATLRLQRTGSTASAIELSADDGQTRLDTRTQVAFLLSTGGSERLRVTGTSGHVCIGRSSTSANAEDAGLVLNPNGQIISAKDGTSTQNMIVFVNNADVTATTVGKIQTSSSATSYVTSSDYRLKENIVDLTGAIDRVKTLTPKRFNFLVDKDTTVDGFLAHEVTAVPEAISGTKDETEAIGDLKDADGSVTESKTPKPETLEDGFTWTETGTRPVHQGIDHSKLVPLLTAALKEAIAKIETLETKVAALEG